MTRFAPAPTGHLHLGHVVNALYVWGAARAAGVPVLLRIEDHDRQRSRPEYEAAIREDLAWLGFSPDLEGPRQSERGAVYERELAKLRARGLVYVCDCTRAAIERAAAVSTPAATLASISQAASAGLGEQADELRYPGTCRGKALAETVGRGVRVRLDDTVERFDDLLHGPQIQRPSAQCGDVLVRDRDGNWTYQFAVTVDDFLQGITLVVRGDDLLPSTGRQIQLARLLGRDRPPRFMHHQLVMKSPDQKLSKADRDTSDQKLSKADRDTSVRDLRAAGYTAADVLGAAVRSARVIDEAGPLSTEDAIAHLARELAPLMRR